MAAKDDRNSRVCEEYLRGDHTADIAERHGITHQRVRQIVVRRYQSLGLEPPRRRAKRRAT